MIGTRLSIATAFFLGVVTLQASTIDELNTSVSTNLISFYGVNTGTDQVQNSSNGMGFNYNTDDIKLKFEGSETSFKTATVLKFNTLQDKLYIKLGANYINQNLYNHDSIDEKVSQYSGALGAGYMLYNDLYLELGSSITEVTGKKTNPDYDNVSETRKNIYAEISKRVEMPIGKIDATFKGSRIYKTLSSHEQSYCSILNYYPDDTIKVGYFYTNTNNNISTSYSINYGFLITEYTNNISQNTQKMIVGMKVKFTDITDFSSYKAPITIKPHLSKLRKFDDMVLHENMNLHI